MYHFQRSVETALKFQESATGGTRTSGLAGPIILSYLFEKNCSRIVVQELQERRLVQYLIGDENQCISLGQTAALDYERALSARSLTMNWLSSLEDSLRGSLKCFYLLFMYSCIFSIVFGYSGESETLRMRLQQDMSQHFKSCYY